MAAISQKFSNAFSWMKTILYCSQSQFFPKHGIDNGLGANQATSYYLDIACLLYWCLLYWVAWLHLNELTRIVREFSLPRQTWEKGTILQTSHNDVIRWKHFPRYWPFMQRIHRSPVNSTYKGQWRGALVLLFICARINIWANNRELVIWDAILLIVTSPQCNLLF